MEQTRKQNSGMEEMEESRRYLFPVLSIVTSPVCLAIFVSTHRRAVAAGHLPNWSETTPGHLTLTSPTQRSIGRWLFSRVGLNSILNPRSSCAGQQSF